MVNREDGILSTAHPRTKSSALYPDTYKDKIPARDRDVGYAIRWVELTILHYSDKAWSAVQ
jgi:hypothetical protein